MLLHATHAKPDASAAAPRDPVTESRRRIDGLAGIRRTIAVIRMWPEQACAEHECVERLRTAAELVGIDVIELDRFGHIVGTPRQRVTRNEVDFVIHLHYETAKTYDAVSVGALWNPTQFYFDWGFDRHWSNQMSHDVYAYTGSAEIKHLVRASRGESVADSMPLLNHTLADPIVPPQPHAKYRAFYCGINWEKLSNRPARHDAVLRELDRRGVLDVYGPREIRGVKLWDGYKGYRGSLPFDGRTIIGKIAEAGACLVFSSDAHLRSEIMSNRLFEAMAAGAVVIGDEHSFIPHAIGDNFVSVPSSLPAEERARKIVAALARFDRHPEEAVSMAKAAQTALIRSFHLCSQLADVYQAVQRFKDESASMLKVNSGTLVDFVIQPSAGDANVIRDRINRLARQCHGRARVIVLVDDKQTRWYERMIDESVQIVPATRTLDRLLTPGEMLEQTASHLSSRKVCFLRGIEEVFVETFVSACIDAGSHPVARVGHVLRHQNAKSEVFYDYTRGASEVHSLHDAAVGCVIFDREWLMRRVPLRGLSWKDACRFAELQCLSVVDCPSTSVVVDLTDYEKLLYRLPAPAVADLDPEHLLRLASPIRQTISSNAAVVARTSATSADPGRTLTEENLLGIVKGMDRERRWKLLLDLYHGVPLPGWLRSTISFLRRLVGIR